MGTGRQKHELDPATNPKLLSSDGVDHPVTQLDLGTVEGVKPVGGQKRFDDKKPGDEVALKIKCKTKEWKKLPGGKEWALNANNKGNEYYT